MKKLCSTFLYLTAYFLGAHTFTALLRVIRLFVKLASECFVLLIFYFLAAGMVLWVDTSVLHSHRTAVGLLVNWYFLPREIQQLILYNILTYKHAYMACLSLTPFHFWHIPPHNSLAIISWFSFVGATEERKVPRGFLCSEGQCLLQKAELFWLMVFAAQYYVELPLQCPEQ